MRCLQRGLTVRGFVPRTCKELQMRKVKWHNKKMDKRHEQKRKGVWPISTWRGVWSHQWLKCRSVTITRFYTRHIGKNLKNWQHQVLEKMWVTRILKHSGSLIYSHFENHLSPKIEYLHTYPTSHRSLSQVYTHAKPLHVWSGDRQQDVCDGRVHNTQLPTYWEGRHTLG